LSFALCRTQIHTPANCRSANSCTLSELSLGEQLHTQRIVARLVLHTKRIVTHTFVANSCTLNCLFAGRSVNGLGQCQGQGQGQCSECPQGLRSGLKVRVKVRVVVASVPQDTIVLSRARLQALLDGVDRCERGMAAAARLARDIAGTFEDCEHDRKPLSCTESFLLCCSESSLL
jgi:hypothetical protein